MEQQELEDALDKVIAASGTTPEDVVATLELLLYRYRDELNGQ